LTAVTSVAGQKGTAAVTSTWQCSSRSFVIEHPYNWGQSQTWQEHTTSSSIGDYIDYYFTEAVSSSSVVTEMFTCCCIRNSNIK